MRTITDEDVINSLKAYELKRQAKIKKVKNMFMNLEEDAHNIVKLIEKAEKAETYAEQKRLYDEAVDTANFWNRHAEQYRETLYSIYNTLVGHKTTIPTRKTTSRKTVRKTVRRA